MSKLEGIAAVVQNIAEAIKSAFSIDVEIIDDRLIRVAATGFAKNKVGDVMSFGVASREVLRTGQAVILQSNKHRICSMCPGRGNCTYYGGIVAPIYLDNIPIGTINVVSYDETKMNEIIEIQTGLIEFLSKMGDLISSKIKEQEFHVKQTEVIGELQTIVNTVPYGVLAVGDRGNIKYYNNLALSMLKVGNRNCLFNSSIYDLFSNFPEDYFLNENDVNQELVLEQKGNSKLIVSSIRKIDEYNNNFIVAMHTILPSPTSIGESGSPTRIKDIIGNSELMKEVKWLAYKFSKSPSTILITGESGTGKDLLAKAIHFESGNNTSPFVAVNCSAIPEALIESELFGYEKGAFTGANNYGKIGKFEQANNGTIFLDEIGTMPLFLQAKLLRVLQTKEIDRVGGTTSKKINVRVIAATNENLEELILKGKFREDLYYRLNVIPIHLPPLRRRKEDIIPITTFIINRFNQLLSKSVINLDNEVIDYFHSYHWKGNIRELENVMEYAMNHVLPNEETIGMENLPTYILKEKDTLQEAKYRAISSIAPSPVQISDIEQQLIKKLLQKYGEDTKGKQKIAKDLGIGIATLYRKIKKYNLVSQKDKFYHNDNSQ
ncbi:sigma 54-interacting transcriptional regulator [Cytobacillus firmus]|nr:sigma 54-interacting transcriptional regulator [Cytobacillus firmus]